MTDRIDIRDLRLRCIIGVNDWERTDRQDVLVNISLWADLRRAGESDKVTDTVNYRTIAKRVIAHVESSARETVEALATDLARICCSLEGVQRARVRLEKPGALRFADSVGVEIERVPQDFHGDPGTGDPARAHV